MYYVYMLRCKDNSIYTGITTDISRRMEEHFSKGDKCAKYTFRHEALKLERVFTAENRSLASKLEFNIKRLNKVQKESIITDKNSFYELLEKYVECEKYNIIDYEVKEIYEKS